MNNESWEGNNPYQKEKTETGAEKEVPVVQESPEFFCNRIKNKATRDVANFQEGFEMIINRANSEGLTIDEGDKNALNELNQEAEEAKKILIDEISGRLPQTPLNNSYFPTPPPLPWESMDIPPPPFSSEKRATPPPFPKEWKDIPHPPVQAERRVTPPPFPPLSEEYQISKMEEREVESTEALSPRETSKKIFAEERQELAEQIRAERELQRKRLLSMKKAIEVLVSSPESIDGLKEDGEFGKIFEMQSTEASELGARIESSELSLQDAQEEKANISNLISNSEGIKSLKAKLVEHYAKADALSKERFETTKKTVEQTLLRNNIFIVHTFLTDELRHNSNSNISKRATIEDDLDTLMSLEPAISTSSVAPGCKHGLWGERIGVILGGGEIKGVVQTDEGTLTGGIKERFGKMSNSHEIDEAVSDRRERGYNELVVNNPKVFGFFQNVNIDESGRMLGFSVSQWSSAIDKKQMKDQFLNYMKIGRDRGMPALIMTPDRRLFEFISVDDNGIVTIGSEITPEQVATGRAGLQKEERIKVGKEIIDKNLFSSISDQGEAKRIIAELSDQEANVELTREEYIHYAKDNPGRIHGFPEHLLADKTFMTEIAQYDPVSTYYLADKNLKKDIDFIKHIYSLKKTGIESSIYASMPEELKKNEAIAILAIENNDFDRLDASFADSPVIWEKLMDKIVENKDPTKWFSRNIGEMQVATVSLNMTSEKGGMVNLSERLVADKNFVRKLNERYLNYEFEVDPYQQIVVTKLGEENV